jgi:hypothetical protein
MDREQEVRKLINVLRRTARMAMQAEWTGSGEESAAHCVKQYNKVLARLMELDAGVGNVFDELPEDSTLTVAAMACRQLAAYFEDEVGSSGWGRVYGAAFDTDGFKNFWERCATDIEDLGEYIRESVENWAKQRGPAADATNTARAASDEAEDTEKKEN